MTRRIVVGGVVLAAFILVVPAFGYLLRTSFVVQSRGSPSAVGLGNFLSLLADPAAYGLFANTLAFGVGSTMVAVLVAGFLALCARAELPVRPVVEVLLTLQLSTAPLIYAIAWLLVLDQRGLAASWLHALGVDGMPFNVNSLVGMILVQGLVSVPIVYFLMRGILSNLDHSLEESALMSGASPLTTFWRVTIPLAAPGIASISLLTLVAALEVFEIPALIGLPGRTQVIVSRVYTLAQSTPPDYGTASALAVVLLGFVALCLFGYARIAGRAERFQTIRGRGARTRPLRSSPWRAPLAVACLVVVSLTTVVPVLTVIWISVVPFFQMPSLAALPTLTFANYQSVLNLTSVPRSIRTSATLAFGAATLAVLLASIAAWVVVRSRSRARWLLDLLITAPLAFPGIVMGLALLSMFAQLPLPVYGTPWILLFAYVVSFMPIAMRYTHPAILQIHPELEESAHLSGATWWTTFRRVVLPLMRSSLAGAWLFVFMISFRELPRSILLYAPGTQVVSVSILDLWENGQLPGMAALSVLLMLGLFTFGLVVQQLGKRAGVLARE